MKAESPKHGFKDGFHDIDGNSLGFKELFKAEWLWLEQPVLAPTSLDWKRVETDADLQTWERGWAIKDEDANRYPRQFPPTLLLNPNTAFMAGTRNGILKAGCILNLTQPVVGLSNEFGGAWNDYARVAAAIFPGNPIVGYQRGKDLQQAQAAGFEVTGKLRIWIPK